MAKDNQISWLDSLAQLKNQLAPEGTETYEPVAEDVTESQKESRLDIILEKKGRAGKTATIICGFTSSTDERIKEIATMLKKKLATGGSSRGGEIILQGDRRQEVKDILASEGIRSRII